MNPKYVRKFIANFLFNGTYSIWMLTILLSGPLASFWLHTQFFVSNISEDFCDQIWRTFSYNSNFLNFVFSHVTKPTDSNLNFPEKSEENTVQGAVGYSNLNAYLSKSKTPEKFVSSSFNQKLTWNLDFEISSQFQ